MPLPPTRSGPPPSEYESDGYETSPVLDTDGQQSIIVLDAGLAQLSGHEIDHLYGRLHTDLMRDGVQPIPVEEYRGTGQAKTLPRRRATPTRSAITKSQVSTL